VTFIALPLPGESFYSWCCFQHTASCSKSSAASALEIAGSLHAPRQVDLPPYLARLPFVDSAASATKALRSHTVGGYYWPFLSDASKNEIVDEILMGSDRHWRHRLCVQSRCRPFLHPLRWCPYCAEEDENAHGRAYWHVRHQLPLSYFCVEHRQVLNVARPQPKTWISVRNATVDWILHSDSDSIGVLAARLGNAILLLDRIEIYTLRKASLLRLRELGVILSIKSVQHRRITSWFQKNSVGTWCAAGPCGVNALASGEWIAGLLWRRRVSHPVLWTVLWMALHDTDHSRAVTGFVSAAHGILSSSDGQLALFENEKQSFFAPDHVRDAFMSSSSYAEVMNALGATRGDIIRWLETDQGLRNDWRDSLRSGRQARCEATLRESIGKISDPNRSYLSENHGAELRWLQEHAPKMLRLLLRSLPEKGATQANIFDLLKRNRSARET
jgi:hypothetical protein